MPTFADFVESLTAGTLAQGGDMTVVVRNGTPVNLPVSELADAGALRTGYMAFFNGQTGVGDLRSHIGVAYSVDGNYFATGSPILAPVPDTWEANHVAQPWLVVVGSIWNLFYGGYRTSTNRWQVGLAVSRDHGRTWTRSAVNPIVALGGAGVVDENGALFPAVLYEPDAPAAKRWKMWYTGTDSGSNFTLAYAYAASPEGPWTKFGRVLNLGTSGAFDDAGLQTGCVEKVDDTYYLFYAGLHSVAGRTQWTGGLATFTDPEGTYTKQGQVLPALTTRVQALTADTLRGAAQVTVADTSVFKRNEPVLLGDNNSSPIFGRVLSIDTAQNLTLDRSADADMTLAQGAQLASVFSWSVTPRNIFRENGRWVMSLSLFQQFPAYLRELNGIAYNDNDTPTGQWTIDIDRGVMLELDPVKWYAISAENAHILPMRNAPLPDLMSAQETSDAAVTFRKRLIAKGIAPYTGTGKVTTANGSGALTGTGTRFTKQMSKGDRVTVGAESPTVTDITSDTAAVVSPEFTAVNTLAAYTVRPFLFRVEDSAGVVRFLVKDDGTIEP